MYYTYILVSRETLIPIYVGEGDFNRVRGWTYACWPRQFEARHGIYPIVGFLYSVSTKREAKSIERELIYKYRETVVNVVHGYRRSLQFGSTRSPEYCAKLSAALRGKPKSPEHSAKVSAALTGRFLSEAHKFALSISHRGQTPSPQNTAAVKVALTGRPKSPETVARMRAAWVKRKERAAAAYA